MGVMGYRPASSVVGLEGSSQDLGLLEIEVCENDDKWS